MYRDTDAPNMTFDHEGPLIINAAQISLVQVAKRVQIFKQVFLLKRALGLGLGVFYSGGVGIATYTYSVDEWVSINSGV